MTGALSIVAIVPLLWTLTLIVVALRAGVAARWRRTVRARIRGRPRSAGDPASASGPRPGASPVPHERIVAPVVPEVVDLFLLALAGGYNVALALGLVAQRAPPPVRSALVEVADLVASGARTADAVALLPQLLGEPIRPLVTVLLAGERYGTPMLPALERVAAEARIDRRNRADEAARRVPVKLLFPLVLCILPAFALLTVVPLLASTLRTLHL